MSDRFPCEGGRKCDRFKRTGRRKCERCHEQGALFPETLDGSNWRPCPHCGAAIVKDGGLPHHLTSRALLCKVTPVFVKSIRMFLRGVCPQTRPRVAVPV